MEEVKVWRRGWVREVGEGWRVGVVEVPPSRRRAGVSGVAEAVRRVVLGAAPCIKSTHLPTANGA